MHITTPAPHPLDCHTPHRLNPFSSSKIMPAENRPIRENEPVSDPFGSDDAIDDSEDLDDDHVEIKKTISNSRPRMNHNDADIKVGEVLPFPFLPNIRPLTVSDLDSCVALENAAFADPEHRCSREKVS